VLRRIVSFKNSRGDTAGASEGSAAVAASASASAAGALQEDEEEEGKRDKGANSSIQQQSLTSINPNPGLASQVALVGDDDLFCTLSKIGYGKGTSNPVLDSTHFYQPNKNMSASSPEAFIEGFVEAGEWEVQFLIMVPAKDHSYFTVVVLSAVFTFLRIRSILLPCLMRSK
jgi:hypothetical protein